MTPKQAAAIFFGTLFFGVLTFISGLFIGVRLAQPTLSAGLLIKPATAATSSPAPTPAPMIPGKPAAEKVIAIAVPLAPVPATERAALPAAAAMVPEPVKEFRVGLPPTLGAVSPLRGPALEAGRGGDGKTATPAVAAAPPFVFSVQVGSFLVQKNAERLAADLAKRGYQPRILTAQYPGEPAWYPVVLSPVEDAGAAQHLAEMYNASEGRRPEIVSWLGEKK